jgi:hypothetical protein
LTGTAFEPPFTRPSVVLTSAVSESAKQGRVAVRFSARSRAAGSGRLKLEFQPAPPAKDNDSTILFPQSNSRSVPFTVAEGDSEAKFGAATEAFFQTGTTAGTIVFTAEVGGFTEQITVFIPPASAKFERSSALREGNSLAVQVSGFDNTQSGGEMGFTFYDRSGKIVQPGTLKANATQDFASYFGTSTLGGAFSLRATFPVAGNASEIDGVEIEYRNPAGVTKSERVKF